MSPGNVVTPTGRPARIPVGDALLGRVLDGLGRPIDDGPALTGLAARPAEGPPPDALSRPRIRDRMPLGVRALDTLVPCGRGQRLGIFAGSGVGKSSLLGMIARSAATDVNVICLVGERGREVLEFIERDLGDAISRSVVVVATSDQPALVRIKAALTATAIAEHFRDRGDDVLLMMDSVTRFAMAQREVGLAVGEPPATRGYTPSVFALLPRLLERSGTSAGGLDHRPLHRSRRRRRHERADRRRRALDPRRPRRADARARARGPLPGDRRAAVGLAPLRRRSSRTTSRSAPPSCAGCSPPTATSATSSRSARTSAAPTRRPTARSISTTRSRRSCASASTSRPPPRRPTPGSSTWSRPLPRGRARRARRRGPAPRSLRRSTRGVSAIPPLHLGVR